eukprot:3739611-Lingulodinium_polyedra.AAC.1
MQRSHGPSRTKTCRPGGGGSLRASASPASLADGALHGAHALPCQGWCPTSLPAQRAQSRHQTRPRSKTSLACVASRRVPCQGRKPFRGTGNGGCGPRGLRRRWPG